MRWIVRIALTVMTLPTYALDTTWMFGVDQSVSHYGIQKSKLSVEIEANTSPSDFGSLTSIVRAQLLGPDRLEPGEFSQPTVSPASQRWYLSDTAELELRELYLDKDFENGRIRLGKQQVVWGQADGLKLLDVVNPQSFREFILEDFEDSRIPLWMVNVELFYELGDLQLLWIPDTSAHSLPGPGATFEFTAPLARIPPGTRVTFEPYDRPDSVIRDSDVGARFSLFSKGWDVTLNYLYRYDDFPVIRKRIDAAGLSLSPSYERTHTVGGSASSAFGSYVIRTELAYNTSRYYDLERVTDNQGVRSTGELGVMIGVDFSGLSNTLLSMQLFQSRLDSKSGFVRDRREVSATFLMRRSFLNESLQSQLLYIRNLNDGDSVVRLSASYELSSELRATLYADLFEGRETEMFGQFDDNDQIGIRLELGL